MEPTPDPLDAEILEQLAALRLEHRQLDAQLGTVADIPPEDELLLRRLKKRKLLLKDQIAQLESRLDPDVYA